jgi:hypothetical protein
MTFDSLCADAAAVVAHAHSLGFDRMALLGTRVGAAVAAATAASLPTAFPLAWWEPVSDPLGFLTEGQRAERMSRATKGDAKVEGWRQQLHRNGMVRLLGYDVYRPMIESLEDVDLMSLLGTRVRPVFVARFRAREDNGDPIVAALEQHGFSPRYGNFGLTEPWWFHSEKAPESGDLITATADWVAERLEEGG